MDQKENIIISLTLKAKEAYIGAAVALVKAVAEAEGFNSKQVLHLETITEEAALNVVHHAFEPGEEGTYDLFISRPPGKIVIALEDKGLPFDSAELETGKGGLGLRLMKGLADEVKFFNLGKKGKRVELVKILPMQDPASLLTEEDRRISENKDVISTEPVEFRMMTPVDATGLTRCVYRTYGYTYVAEYLYNPQELREMLAAGIIESFLAVTASNEIVGHLGMLYHKAGAMVAESAQAVVDNRFRGRKLFEKLKIQLLEYAAKKGLYGIYSEATTVHPYSQKGNVALGAVETGFVLAYLNESTVIRDIETKAKEMRISGLLYYLKVNEEPTRTIYVPEKHKEMIFRILDRIKLNREVGVPQIPHDLQSASIIRSKVRPDFGHAFVTIDHYGDDFEASIKSLLRQIKNQKVPTIFLDMPMSDQYTPYYYKMMEGHGFSFSCIIPEYEDGDIIRMQYLNNVYLDQEKIAVASDFGKELLKYVFDDLKNN
jgi:serine/threonine-protein kinase RsbW